VARNWTGFRTLEDLQRAGLQTVAGWASGVYRTESELHQWVADHFPDLERGQVGEVADWIRQAHQAGRALESAEGPLLPESMPVNRALPAGVHYQYTVLVEIEGPDGVDNATLTIDSVSNLDVYGIMERVESVWKRSIAMDSLGGGQGEDSLPLVSIAITSASRRP
jgi:hypothetical protein